MDTEQIITQLDSFQAKLFVRGQHGVEPADPVTLANNLLLIRGLLIQLVEKVFQAETDYRHTKAARFDQLLTSHKPGEKPLSKSAAMDKLEMETDLIEKKTSTERLRNYLKYIDGLCTSIQSVLKVQTSSDKAQY